MPCCFRSPKQNYGIKTKTKQKDKKHNQQNRNASTERNADETEQDALNHRTEVDGVTILVNGEPLVAEDSRRHSAESDHSAKEVDTTAETRAVQSDTVHKEAPEDPHPSTEHAFETNEIDLDNNNNNDCQEEIKTQSDPISNTVSSSDKKGEVFVITRDARNSFYGSALLMREQEKQKKDMKRQREEEVKQKMEALKAMNAERVDRGSEEVRPNMQETSPEIKTAEPAPDYSNDESENKVEEDEDYVELRKTVKNRISTMLSREQWDQILDRTTLDEIEEKEKEPTIPEPDYDGAPKTKSVARSHTFSLGAVNSPKTETEAKIYHDLQRELLMNKKLGIDVLHRKSELQKELSRRRDKQRERMLPLHNSLELKLKQRVQHNQSEKDDDNGQLNMSTGQVPDSEFMRIHSKIYSKVKPNS